MFPIGAFAAGAGQEMSQVPDMLMRQRQYQDELAANQLVGQLLSQGGGDLWQAGVPGASPVSFGPRAQNPLNPSPTSSADATIPGSDPNTPPPVDVPGAKRNDAAGGSMFSGMGGRKPGERMLGADSGDPNAAGIPSSDSSPPISPKKVRTVSIKKPEDAGGDKTPGTGEGGSDEKGPSTGSAGAPGAGGIGGMNFGEVLRRIGQNPIARRNPGAAAKALQYFIPFLNAETKMQAMQYLNAYREQQLLLSQQKADIAGLNAQTAQQRAQTEKRRADQGDVRLSLAKARIELTSRDLASKIDERLARVAELKRRGNWQQAKAEVEAAKAQVSAVIQAAAAGVAPDNANEVIKQELQTLNEVATKMMEAIDQAAREAGTGRDSLRSGTGTTPLGAPTTDFYGAVGATRR